ncbi:hypothetical protein GJW-30_1_03956 [Variibacter gotjawalensis]|uniref:Uncharacterized protein n=1 Tax=Variibacter gotjawalensis TaxID=1333996 RepID=A0A0S3PZP0_9BRAD|nr:hypothetical protein [Variibacter gotjawalensis]NIK47237.1 hypothetical protein [Variibacter gotjawalensis]RZS49137.1 hypothetical protein EV661_1562 [Variibacter gotjawalensis]BAT61399.1 hypothetical protein GJW-30_1_03956 [Variibacter gotjawalensis]
MSDRPHDTPAQATNTSPRWLVWGAAFAGAAVLGGLFAVWGIEGPKYLLDVIAAYCF